MWSGALCRATTRDLVNIVPTLSILKALVDDGVINDFEVTSAYRALSLNRCAGGADASRHVFTQRLDFRIDQNSLAT